ncbi:chromosome segregation DNA-binding protein [Sanguibacter gelidistatuariae]|uniref:Chromosome segregation DNA-binding protein n=1 Tax=Sanguibacter gelidistatuariae TaxID=1814289 RepID=A0A1G6H3M0_9MICO|nr:chromosome segregation DNA-binding protein [Sanguibacter gelidistatuariae]
MVTRQATAEPTRRPRPASGDVANAGGPTPDKNRAGRSSADGPAEGEVPATDALSTSTLDASPGMSARVKAESKGANSSRTSVPSLTQRERGTIRIDSVSRETYVAATGAEPTLDLLPVPGASFAELPVESIHPNSRQPRTIFDENDLAELVGSILEVGVLQPIVVRPSQETDGYELIMGERRWRATQQAGLTTIPAIIRETEDGDLLRDALLENLHRSALNPLEEAAAYRQLLDDFGCTHEELASRISRSRPQISNTLRLLKLPPLVQRRVAAGVISAGHARALLGLADRSEIERLAQRIVAEGLSVRATEEIVALGGLDEEKKVTQRPRAGARIQAIDELASRLSDRFETRVKVDLGKTKGKVTVEFASVEDLNRILNVMAPEEPGLFKK